VESSPNLPVSTSLDAELPLRQEGQAGQVTRVLALIAVVGLPFGLGGAEVGIPSRPRVDRPDLAVGEARIEPGASRGLTVVDDQRHPHGRRPCGSGLRTFAPDVDT
jgi:hypothetical protein